MDEIIRDQAMPLLYITQLRASYHVTSRHKIITTDGQNTDEKQQLLQNIWRAWV